MITRRLYEIKIYRCDEIRFAVDILRFVNVCSDTGSGSADLRFFDVL